MRRRFLHANHAHCPVLLQMSYAFSDKLIWKNCHLLTKREKKMYALKLMPATFLLYMYVCMYDFMMSCIPRISFPLSLSSSSSGGFVELKIEIQLESIEHAIHPTVSQSIDMAIKCTHSEYISKHTHAHTHTVCMEYGKWLINSK